MKKELLVMALACSLTTNAVQAAPADVKLASEKGRLGAVKSMQLSAAHTNKVLTPGIRLSDNQQMVQDLRANSGDSATFVRHNAPIAKKKAPMELGGFNIQGCYFQGEQGWYQIDPNTGNMEKRFTLANHFDRAIVYDDLIYGFKMAATIFGMYLNQWQVYRLSDGVQVAQGNFELDYAEVIQCGAFVPEDDVVYVLTYDSDLSRYQFKSFDLKTMKFTLIKDRIPNSNFYGMTYNPDDKKIYAVDRYGDVYTFDKSNGEKEKVGNIGDFGTATYSGALTYSTKLKALLLSPDKSEQRGIYKLDAADGYKAVQLAPMDFAFSTMLSLNDYDEDKKPAEVTDDVFTFVRGANEGTIAAVMPTTTITDAPLTGKVKLVVMVDGKVHGESPAVNPGETATAHVAIPTGNHTYKLYAQTVDGDYCGARITRYNYIGVDTPHSPKVKAREDADNLGVTITWSLPEEYGDNNGFIDPSVLTYTVYLQDKQTQQWNVIAEGLKNRTFHYRMDNAEPIDITSLAVNAVSATGPGQYSGLGYAMLGTPLQLPLEETFPDNKFTYPMVLFDGESKGFQGHYVFMNPNEVGFEWAADPEKEENKYTLIGIDKYVSPGLGQVAMPKFSTLNAKNPQISQHVFIHPDLPPTDVIAYTDDREVVLHTLTSADPEGWQTLTYSLPKELLGKQWVGIEYRSHFAGGDNEREAFILNEYAYTDLLNRDVTVRYVKGDRDLRLGGKGNYTAEVENVGTDNVTISGGVWKVTNNGRVMKTIPAIGMEEVLAPGDKRTFSVELDADAGTVGVSTVSFTVNATDDNQLNNVAQTKLYVAAGTKSVVNDLSGYLDEENGTVELNWNTPKVYNTEVEGFEDCDDWEYGEYIGRFKNIDLDGLNTLCFTNYMGKFPGSLGDPRAFQVFNWSLVKGDEIVSAVMPYAGKHHVVAMCPRYHDDGTDYHANDWFISPEVLGGSRVTFQMQISNDQKGGETLEVLYSTTTDEVSEFKHLTDIYEGELTWHEKEFTLPDDAKYFAFHYGMEKGSSVMFDDICYQAAVTPEVYGYNVYCDGVKIADMVIGNAFTHSGVDLSTIHNYEVAAVIKDGDRLIEQPKSNVVTIAWSGIEELMMNADAKVEVFTIDGVKVPYVKHGMEPGIYVIKQGNVVKKVRIQ